MNNSDTDSGGASVGRTGRRRLLKAIGGLGVVGLAGCGGDGDGEDTTEPDTTTTEGTTPTETDTATSTATATGTPTATPTATPPPQTIPEPASELLAFDSESTQTTAGATVTLTGTLTNTYLFDVRDVEVSLAGPSDDWGIEATGDTRFDTIGSQSTEDVGWEVTVPDGAEGDQTLTATVEYATEDDSATAEVSTSVFIVGDEIPQEGQVAYVSLDGDTATNEVTGTDATTYGDPAPGATGVSENTGDAFAFDGEGGNNSDSDDGDAITTGEALAINGESATIAAWVNWNRIRDYDRLFSVAPDPTTNMTNVNGYQVYTNPDSNLRFEGTDSASGVDFTTATGILSTGTWFFVVAVWDEGDARLHVFDEDGELDASPWTASPGERGQDESQNLTLAAGTDPFDTAYYSAVTLDEAYAYSRGLSQGEVAALYVNSF